jgi:hypothetical protein
VKAVGLLALLGKEARPDARRGTMEPFEWSTLNNLQLGRYAEYSVKMEFTKLGFSVFSPEVDDRGIDFVIRTRGGQYYEVQVKSSSPSKSGRGFNYQFWRKGEDKLQIGEHSYIALVLFTDGDEPRLYLIPTTVWKEPNPLFVDHDYSGLRSKPEYGLNLSEKNLSLLQPFAFSEKANFLT